MNKLYLVTLSWDNDGTYEDALGSSNEFVGLFDSYDKAKECIMSFKELDKKIFDKYYENNDDMTFERWYVEQRIDNADRFQWVVPLYGDVTNRYDIEEYEINSFEKYFNSTKSDYEYYLREEP